MSEKYKAPRLYVRGTARFPKTDKPYTFDQAKSKSVPDPDGKYSIEVIITPAELGKHKSAIEEAARAGGLKKVKNWPFTEEIDKDTDEPTGNFILKASQYGKNKDGSKRKMPHVDASGAPIRDPEFRLTSGSTVIIAVRPNSYKTLGGGVNLYLDGVQVVKLAEGGAGNLGFGAVEEEGAYIAGENDPGFGDAEDEDTEADGEADTDF